MSSLPLAHLLLCPLGFCTLLRPQWDSNKIRLSPHLVSHLPHLHLRVPRHSRHLRLISHPLRLCERPHYLQLSQFGLFHLCMPRHHPFTFHLMFFRHLPIQLLPISPSRPLTLHLLMTLSPWLTFFRLSLLSTPFFSTKSYYTFVYSRRSYIYFYGSHWTLGESFTHLSL
jgi:hypothetical protein